MEKFMSIEFSISFDRFLFLTLSSTANINILITKKTGAVYLQKKTEMKVKNNDAHKVAHGLSLLSHASKHEFEVNVFRCTYD